MKVLHVVTDTDRRGGQIFARDLNDAMLSRGIDSGVSALAPGAVGGESFEVLGPSRFSPRTLGSAARRVRDVDVVIAHGSSTLPVCALVCGRRVPFISRQISETRFWSSTRFRRARVSTYHARAAHTVALAESAAADLNALLRVPSEKITVIPNGVPAAEFEPADAARRREAAEVFGLDPARPVVLSIGALVPEKGVDFVVRAVSGTPDAQLLVVGDGAARLELQALARSLLPGRSHFAGSIDEPRYAYAAADVVVLASTGGDSMPAVLIEAAYCGLPVVATPVGAIAETVRHGATGLIVPIGDGDAVQHALASLLADEELVARMGAAARKEALARFDIDVVADQWLNVAERIIQSR